MLLICIRSQNSKLEKVCNKNEEEPYLVVGGSGRVMLHMYHKNIQQKQDIKLITSSFWNSS